MPCRLAEEPANFPEGLLLFSSPPVRLRMYVKLSLASDNYSVNLCTTYIHNSEI